MTKESLLSKVFLGQFQCLQFVEVFCFALFKFNKTSTSWRSFWTSPSRNFLVLQKKIFFSNLYSVPKKQIHAVHMIRRALWLQHFSSLMENCLQQRLYATTKSSFLATQKSDILCNTEVHHFCNQKFQHFFSLQQKFFVAKNAEISDCKNGRLPCCTKCPTLVLQESSILSLY